MAVLTSSAHRRSTRRKADVGRCFPSSPKLVLDRLFAFAACHQPPAQLRAISQPGGFAFRHFSRRFPDGSKNMREQYGRVEHALQGPGAASARNAKLRNDHRLRTLHAKPHDCLLAEISSGDGLHVRLSMSRGIAATSVSSGGEKPASADGHSGPRCGERRAQQNDTLDDGRRAGRQWEVRRALSETFLSSEWATPVVVMTLIGIVALATGWTTDGDRARALGKPTRDSAGAAGEA
jgi:hypothetical protein